MRILRAGAAELRLLPEGGAAVVGLAWRGRDLIVPVPAGADPNEGFHGGYWMAPWTNRLDCGRIAIGGQVHRMPINRLAEGTALHGFLRELPWIEELAGSDRTVLTCRFDRPPFFGAARLELELGERQLAIRMGLSNEAAVPTPLGLGWHPYFPRPAGTRLRARAGVVFGRDARNLPIAPRPAAGLDGADAVLDGLDTHFAGWDGNAAIRWPDGAELLLSAAGAWSSNLQVFAPRGAAVIAVEPVSHAPDSANRAASAAHGAMHLVQPGASVVGSLMIHWS